MARPRLSLFLPAATANAAAAQTAQRDTAALNMATAVPVLPTVVAVKVVVVATRIVRPASAAPNTAIAVLARRTAAAAADQVLLLPPVGVVALPAPGANFTRATAQQEPDGHPIVLGQASIRCGVSTWQQLAHPVRNSAKPTTRHKRTPIFNPPFSVLPDRRALTHVSFWQ